MTPGKFAIVLLGLGLGFAGVTSESRAQIPGIPGVGSGAGAVPGLGGASGLGGTSGVAGAAGAAGAAAPKGLCAGLKACLAGCKQKICASPYGTLLNNAAQPYSTLSGGLIPQFCPTVPTDSQIAALSAAGGPNGAEAVAAKVKQDEAEAKARRAAVRYLATVDCHYWPDAEVAIIASLRDDRNECVRYEAALALLNGCCCNARTIEALNIVVSGSEKDGKPSETSERVRCTALLALQGCLLRYTPEPLPPPVPPEPPEAPPTLGSLDPSARRVAYYYQTLPRRPVLEVVAEARATAARAKAAAPPVPHQAPVGERSVYHAMVRANALKSAADAPALASAAVPAEPDPGMEGGRLVPVAAPASAAPAPSTATTNATSAPTTTDAALAPASASRLGASAPAGTGSGTTRGAGRSRPTFTAPTPAPALEPMPSRAGASREASSNRSHRGLIGIMRDSARSTPGT